MYLYEKKDIEADAKVADVKYTKRCDTNYVSMCQKKRSKYGYGKEEEVCKEVPQETCYNRPQVRHCGSLEVFIRNCIARCLPPK